MYEWHRQIQIIVDEIDKNIIEKNDENLTLLSLSKKIKYSKFHTTRKFKELSGMSFREYLISRKLAFSIIDLRDTSKDILEIAMDYGFSSHEAFTRAFKRIYNLTPKEYRKNKFPIVLHTKIRTFDRYLLGLGEAGMIKSTEKVKIYMVSIPKHKFLHIKNYESDGYFDFWEKQDKIPGQDCDTICGLLDSIKGKLDGNDNVIGEFSGQIMAHIYEDDDKKAEAYGVRLPESYNGKIPDEMLLIDIPEGEYMVFEHGPFDYENESVTVGDRLQAAIEDFDFNETEYVLDESKGRISYFYFDPKQYEKRIKPVKKREI